MIGPFLKSLTFLLAAVGPPMLITLSSVASAQNTSEAQANIENHILSGQAFLVYTSNIRLYEDPDAVVIRNVEVVHWLGPPSTIVDDNGLVKNLVSHCLQFHIDVDSSLAQGAQIPGKWSTQGFSAARKANGYNYLIADFSDTTQFRFSDEGEGLIPFSGWETSTRDGSGGLVDSGTLSWADMDNLLVQKMSKNLGSSLTPDAFNAKYKDVYEEEHVPKDDVGALSGALSHCAYTFVNMVVFFMSSVAYVI